MMYGIINGVNNVFALLYLIILVRILISWIPKLNREKQPWITIIIIADAYLGIFRRIIPPISGIDWSPIIALIVLQIIQGLINAVLGAI
ncbi:YggT family protein [Spirochaetes bacterium]|uniref:YggT family protein n=1 Tax=Candidatus Scatousia excrementipullorum TaxID=2840936 RepID=A0A9D9DSY9_9BACT|nr:YggT family protein [Candidatus Scatousia excrementipullorum]